MTVLHQLSVVKNVIKFIASSIKIKNTCFFAKASETKQLLKKQPD